MIDIILIWELRRLNRFLLYKIEMYTHGLGAMKIEKIRSTCIKIVDIKVRMSYNTYIVLNRQRGFSMAERSTNTKDISDLWLAMKRKHRRLSLGLAPNRLLRLSDSEIDILWMMNLSDSLVVGDISKRLDLPKSTVTGLVARLESRGYIVRQINPLDLRTYSLFLSEKGKALVSEYVDFEKALFHRLMAPLTLKESRLFLNLLGSMVDDGGKQDE